MSRAAHRRVHLVGIGGVGMAALAVLLKDEGWEVDGCDLHESARTRWLRAQGIPVAVGHSPAHLEGADAVVATPAVPRDSEEFLAAGGRLRWRGEVLAEIVSRRDTIAVCGSHGKTTTATFTAKLLRSLGEDPAWAIGGETGSFPVAACGAGPLVVEADESDGTLALYRASTLVVTNCEWDHPDHFKTPEEYYACYDAARRNAKDVIEAGALDLDGWNLPVLGEHNRRNARAAVEVALRRGHSREAIEAALPGVLAALPDRRFQRLADGLVTDYAHHPTEMRCAVLMARAECAGTLRVLFQPHRYSRTKALLKDFPAAFAGADELVLCPTYAAFEKPVEGGHVADLYRACRQAEAAPRIMLARSCDEAFRHARLMHRPGDLTLVLGAGDIIVAARADEWPSPWDAAERVVSLSSGRDLSRFSFFRTGGRTFGGGPRRLVGAGSNLWISDLATDEEYVPAAQGRPASRPGASLAIPWMAGVPGTVGGWVKMNAGAFGHSISEVVRRVLAGDRWLERRECGFAYRSSAIHGEILDVEFDEDALDAARKSASPAEYLSLRPKFPPRCCGSVFKNPPGDHAGRLLEAAGAKQLRVGGAYVWQDHANVIAAGDGATSSDILALASLCRNAVFHRFGVLLEPEIDGLD